MYKKIILMIGIFFALAVNASAFSFGIDSPSIHVKTWPGETKDLELTVYSLSQDPLQLNVSVEDWKYREDRTKQFLAKGTGPFSCGKWIEPADDSFTLAPGEKKKLRFKIKTPQDAQGGHQAVLFLEGAPATDNVTNKGKSGVLFSGKIGAIVYQETEGKTMAKGEIADLTVQQTGSTLKASVKFKNTGNTCLQTKGSVVLVNNSGDTLANAELSPIKTLPQETALGQAVLKNALNIPSGKYKLLATVDLGSEILVKEVNADIKGLKGTVPVAVTTVPVAAAKPPVSAVAGKASKAQITKYTVLVNPDEKVLKFFAKFLNSSAEAQVLKSTVHIVNSKGVLVKSLSFAETKAGPGQDALLQDTWKYAGMLRPGIYNTKLYVKKGDELFMKTERFTIP